LPPRLVVTPLLDLLSLSTGLNTNDDFFVLDRRIGEKMPFESLDLPLQIKKRWYKKKTTTRNNNNNKSITAKKIDQGFLYIAFYIFISIFILQVNSTQSAILKTNRNKQTLIYKLLLKETQPIK
jgi:hypothetical protein